MARAIEELLKVARLGERNRRVIQVLDETTSCRSDRFDRLNLPQATRLQPVVRRVSPVELQPVPLSHRSGISKRVMIIVNDP